METKILIAVLLVLFPGGFLCLWAYNSLNAALESLASGKIENVDLSKISDGSYKAFPVSAEVKVEIKDHKILYIKGAPRNTPFIFE